MEPHSATGLVHRLKDLTPQFARRLSRAAKAAIRNWRNRNLTAREVFTRVYADKIWGQGDENFYSGPGSDPEAAKPYADFVTGFMAENNIRCVVDLGCGDFRVGRMIAASGIDYVGTDVVQPLIDENNKRFRSDHVRFDCLDIASDDLPDGELCLIREVFQHISNAQISRVLAKLKKYDHVLFTDVQPENIKDFRINKDKVQGDTSRLVHRACLRLDAPPFNVKGIKMVFETDPPYFESFTPYGSNFKLRTFYWKPN